MRESARWFKGTCKSYVNMARSSRRGTTPVVMRQSRDQPNHRRLCSPSASRKIFDSYRDEAKRMEKSNTTGVLMCESLPLIYLVPTHFQRMSRRRYPDGATLDDKHLLTTVHKYAVLTQETIFPSD